MKLNTKILNNKYLTHIAIIVLLVIILVLVYMNCFMGKQKYREFFQNLESNKCKSETCKEQENGPSSQCMLECCREECKGKNEDKIIVNGRTLPISELQQCNITCRNP